MKFKLLSILIIGLLLGTMFVGTFNVADDAEAETISVPASYSTIQDAVTHAVSGETIRVAKGTYHETIIIDKTLTLVGEDKSNTVIDGGGFGTTLIIAADSVEISNFTIINSGSYVGDAGIRLEYVQDCSIAEIEISNCWCGISLLYSDRNTIKGINCADSNCGILLDYSDENTITECTFSNQRDDDSKLGTDDAASSEIIHFAAAADQHYGYKLKTIPKNDADTVEDWMHHPDLPEFDFVLASLGDWISDERAEDEWQDTDYCWKMITENNANRQKIPYFWAFGNHDITNYEYMVDGNPVRKERTGRAISGMNENNYAYMYNNVLFICAAQTNSLFHLSEYQCHWIEYLIKRYYDKTTVILTHQATYKTTGNGKLRSSSWVSDDYKVHNDVEWWRNLFGNNPQIKMYIHGHTHRGYNTTTLDSLPSTWDDYCTFVLVPSNGLETFDPSQDGWSYIFEIAEDHIIVKLWDSINHSFVNNSEVGVPYIRMGMENNLTNSGLEWFSIPKRVLDGQTWEWKNHMVAEGYTLEFVGTERTEQLDNSDLTGCHDGSEDNGKEKAGYWYAVRGDINAINKDTGESDGYIMIKGNNTLELAVSPSTGRSWIEGKVPYNTAIAVPGKTYVFACRIRTKKDIGAVDYLISIPEYLNINEYVWRNHPISSDIKVGSKYTIYSQTFTVPNDDSAWFIQPHIYFHEGAVYFLDSWSLKIVGDDKYTRNFDVELNGETNTYMGELHHNQYASFNLENTIMNNSLQFKCSIEGNKVGFIRMVYEAPQLWSDDVSFGIRDEAGTGTSVYLEDVSPYNNRTSIMSFKGAGYDVYGLKRELVRGKFCYFNDAHDDSLNGLVRLGPVLDVHGIYLRSCNNNNLTKNKCLNLENGIVIDSSSNSNMISENYIYSNLNQGISVYSSTDNTISGNSISNTSVGIYLDSDSNTISGNEIINNNKGIYIEASTGNNITDNTFSGNEYSIYFGDDEEQNETPDEEDESLIINADFQTVLLLMVIALILIAIFIKFVARKKREQPPPEKPKKKPVKKPKRTSKD